MPTMTRTIIETVEVPDLQQRDRALIKPIDPYEMGLLLEQARIMKKWSQREVGIQSLERFGLDLSRSSVSAWEEGANLPSLSAFECLVAVLSPPGGLDWFAPAYCPELRAARGMTILPNVRDPWME